MVTFWCYACNAEHDNARDCPHYVDLSGRGSKESRNRKYAASGSNKRCSRGCKGKPHPDNLCPKNRDSIMHPRNKAKRDRRTHKESIKHDKTVAEKKGCAVTALAFGGGVVVTLAVAVTELVRAL